MRHRVTGVDGKVQYYLLDLPGIRHDIAGIGRNAYYQLDVFADQTAEHLLQFTDHRAHTYDCWLDDLFSAEGKQLRGERSRPFTREPDLIQVLAMGIVRAHFAEGHVSVPVDY